MQTAVTCWSSTLGQSGPGWRPSYPASFKDTEELYRREDSGDSMALPALPTPQTSSPKFFTRRNLYSIPLNILLILLVNTNVTENSMCDGEREEVRGYLKGMNVRGRRGRRSRQRTGLTPNSGQISRPLLQEFQFGRTLFLSRPSLRPSEHLHPHPQRSCSYSSYLRTRTSTPFSDASSYSLWG